MAESIVSSSFVVSNSDGDGDNDNSSLCLRMQRNAVEWGLLLSSFASPGAEEQRASATLVTLQM